jgi:thiamine kinase-like enzyme
MGVQDIGTIQQIGLYEKFEEYFAQISDVLTGSEIKDIRRTIDSTFELASNLPVLMAVLHGDFHCSNLLVTPDLRIGSLDAECMRGPIYEDIAKLLADLETRSLQLYTFGLLIPQHRMERIWATVLNGYFGSIPPNHLLLNLFTVLAILYKWKIDEDLLLHSTGIQQMIRKILSPIRRQAMRVILKKHLDRLALQTSALPAIESVVTA